MRSGPTNRKAIIILLFLLLFSACTPEKKYRILSFFFDGVPNPSATKATSAATEKEKQAITEAERSAEKIKNILKRTEAKRTVSSHPPYVKRQCNRCHDQTSRNMLVTGKQALCFQCHDKKKFTGPYVHGPVAVGACLMCHLPHQSKYPSLLTRKTPGLCLQCHNKQDVFANENHEGVSDCLECHRPHTGEDPMFLQ